MSKEARGRFHRRTRQSQQQLMDRNAIRDCTWTARGARNPVPSNLSLATSLPLRITRLFPFLGQTHKAAEKASLQSQALLSVRTPFPSASCTHFRELQTGCETRQFRSRTRPLASLLVQASESYAILYVTGTSWLEGPPPEHEDVPNSGDTGC